MSFLVFDTSIFIDELRTGCHQQRIRSVSGVLRTSSVVLAELWRGATKAEELTFLQRLARNHPILTPTERNWIESGQILNKIRTEQGLAPDKLRDLHFDLLIALTARSHGARVITSNRADYDLIHRYKKFQLELW